MNKMLEINYFDFLRMYPDIIVENLCSIDDVDFINYIENLHNEREGKRPLIMIDQNKLSEIVRDGKTNEDKHNIFKKEIKINIKDNNVIIITHTDKRKLFCSNNLNQKIGNFYINGIFNSFHNSDFYYPDKDEIKNIKRSLLIEKCLK